MLRRILMELISVTWDILSERKLKTKTLTIGGCIKISMNKKRSQSIWWENLISRYYRQSIPWVPSRVAPIEHIPRFIEIYVHIYFLSDLYVPGPIRFSTLYYWFATIVASGHNDCGLVTSGNRIVKLKEKKEKREQCKNNESYYNTRTW